MKNKLVEASKCAFNKISLMFNFVLVAFLMFYLPQSYIALKANPGPAQWTDWLHAAAEWLYEQDDILNDDVAVCSNTWDAWQVYYVEQCGQRQAPNYIINANNISNTINRIYTVEAHVAVDWQRTVLGEEFELIQKDDKLHTKKWQRNLNLQRRLRNERPQENHSDSTVLQRQREHSADVRTS